MKVSTAFVFCLALAASGVAAAQHNHFTLDTRSGMPGDDVRVVAGYLPGESDYEFDESGRLRLDDQLVTYEHDGQIDQPGPIHGWFAGSQLTLTSDFFVGTGRLDGGDFAYEIAGVEPLLGAPADFAWTTFQGVFHVHARASGASRDERSFTVGFGGHQHGQFWALSGPGVYEITLIAWDRNGVYGDSEPVSFRVDAIAGCVGDADGDGEVGFGDVLRILATWGNKGGPEDVDYDGTVGFGDVLTVLAWWGSCSG